MKKIAKNLVARILGWQVRRLNKRNKIITIGVVGSIGKTSTKFAIARVLGEAKKVRFQEGNYNDIVTVPLVFFGHQTPNILNPFAWLKIMLANEKILSAPYPFEVVVLELGTDGPGQIGAFESYLHLDFAVVTAVTPEHMEYFADLDAVAREELSVSSFADKLVVNIDLCDEKYLKNASSKLITYGTADSANFRITNTQFSSTKVRFNVTALDGLDLAATMEAISNAEVYSASASIVIASMGGIPKDQITAAIAKLKPVAGRMQRLQGVKGSVIIDETYNASPVAVKAALDSLYTLKAPQKIAILGNMNELGEMTEEAHREIGNYCEPNQLNLVVTIGPDANKFTAEEAKKNGCIVATFDDPYSAGEFVRNRIKEGAIVLAKGSQNGVFAEEAVKILLKDSNDESLLVRQSAEWLKVKAKNFNG